MLYEMDEVIQDLEHLQKFVARLKGKKISIYFICMILKRNKIQIS